MGQGRRPQGLAVGEEEGSGPVSGMRSAVVRVDNEDGLPRRQRR